MSTTNIINLGEIPVCREAVVLPVIATESGTWAFMTSFNGAYQYVQFTATSGQNIVVPAKLNEDYAYTFKLYKPDSSLLNDDGYYAKTIPLLVEVQYTCPDVEGGSAAFSTGKLQFIATEGQAAFDHFELATSKQVAVFVEGAMWQEGNGADEYSFSQSESAITFNSPLIEGQKITIIYFNMIIYYTHQIKKALA